VLDGWPGFGGDVAELLRICGVDIIGEYSIDVIDLENRFRGGSLIQKPVTADRQPMHPGR
jgi:hypothetical protein